MSVKYQKIYGIKSNSQRTSISIEPENSDPTEKIKSRRNQLTTRKEDEGEEKRKDRGRFTRVLNTSPDSNLGVENSHKIEMNLFSLSEIFLLFA